MNDSRHLFTEKRQRKIGSICASVCLILIGVATSRAQAAAEQKSENRVSPSFEVATVKPFHAGPKSLGGFYFYPNGKIFVGGATILTLIHFAFDIQEFQVAGGPKWVKSARFDVTALEPESLRDTRQVIEKAWPSPSQREMLQHLLSERFGLVIHQETKDQAVLLLTKGDGELKMGPAKDSMRDPRGGVWVTPDGIADGRAMGVNMTMPLFANQISEDMERLVVDRTGLSGAYDFFLKAEDPDNHDIVDAVIKSVGRLGLKLKPGRAPVETIVIDQVTQPTEN